MVSQGSGGELRQDEGGEGLHSCGEKEVMTARKGEKNSMMCKIFSCTHSARALCSPGCRIVFRVHAQLLLISSTSESNPSILS
jgi:hypothetical protein